MGQACVRGKKRNAAQRERDERPVDTFAAHSPSKSSQSSDRRHSNPNRHSNDREPGEATKLASVEASEVELGMLDLASESTGDSRSHFPGRISANAEDVIKFIQQTWESDMFRAQEYLYDVLDSRREEDFVTPIRESAPYVNLIRLLGVYNKVPGVLCKTDGFDQAGVIDIDFEALGFSDSLGCRSRIPVYWEKVGAVTKIRLSVEFPLMHQTGNMYSVGYALLWDELDLWPSWHPMATGTPRVCIGGEQDELSDFRPSSRRLFDEHDRVAKIFHISQLVWHYKFFPPNRACFVDVFQSISDDAAFDDSENRALLQQFLPLKGYRRLSEAVTGVSFCTVQKETVFLAIGFDLHIPRWAPKFFISWMLRNFIPGMVNNMSKSVGNALVPESDYSPRLREDRKGLYKRVSELHERGAAQEEARGYRYDPNHLPDPIEEFCIGSKNLIDLDADLAREFPH